MITETENLTGTGGGATDGVVPAPVKTAAQVRRKAIAQQTYDRWFRLQPGEVHGLRHDGVRGACALMPMEKAGEYMGVSRQAAHQLERKALLKVREALTRPEEPTLVTVTEKQQLLREALAWAKKHTQDPERGRKLFEKRYAQLFEAKAQAAAAKRV
jgi:predicted DNA-binding protein (UPF0251 family)